MLVFLSVYKVFYFIRIYDEFSGLLILVEKCAREAIPFAIMILFLLFGLGKIYLTLHMGINDPTDQYEGIGSEISKMILQTYKSMSGEKIAPKLDDSISQRFMDNSVALSIIFSIITIVYTF